jgi:hypothetical protein
LCYTSAVVVKTNIINQAFGSALNGTGKAENGGKNKMRWNLIIHWQEASELVTEHSEDFMPSTFLQKTQANEMVYTMHCLNAKATLTFQIDSKGQFFLNDIHWQKTTQRKKPEGLENIDLETKKAIRFFFFMFRYEYESGKYVHNLYLSEKGLMISCDILNEEGEKAFRKLYEMQFIIHSMLRIGEHTDIPDFELSINSKCILDPFVEEMIREEDDTLPSYEELFGLFSSGYFIEDEEEEDEEDEEDEQYYIY